MVSYILPLLLFEKGLAFVNFAAIFSFYVQIPGLIESNGITPASIFLQRTKRKYRGKSNLSLWYNYPTLFWICSSDSFLNAVALVGLVACVIALFGFIPFLGIAISMICYLSLKVVGQPWLGLQMHATVIETDFVYLISAPLKSSNPFLQIFLLRFLIWRIMLGCGACKYGTGDKTWRNLTAMNYHYYTQPLPNPLSWYVNKFPDWYHKLAVVMTHLVEGPLTFLTWGNWLCRVIAFVLFVGLNVMINVTGNYGFLGVLTTVQCFSLLDDDILSFMLPFVSTTPTSESPSLLIQLISATIATPYIVVSLYPLLDTFYGQIPFLKETYSWLQSFSLLKQPVAFIQTKQQTLWQRILSSHFVENYWLRFWNLVEFTYSFLSPLRIVNRYAKFGTMSTKRWELIVEGSEDGKDWKSYEFKYKPGNVSKRPPILPLHLPGLDWRIWFLPSAVRRHGSDSLPEWYQNFLVALLKGNQKVLNLLEYNPFPKSPPKYVRTLMYDYKFCYGDPQKWWFREFITSCGTLSLS